MKIAVIGSLLLSILHSILFWGHRAGISVLLFVIPAVFFVLYLLEKKEKIKNKKAMALTIPILLLASCYLLFDNTFLQVINFFAIILLLVSMVIWLISDKFEFTYFLAKIFNLILGPIEFVGDSLKEIKRVLVHPKKEQQETNQRTNLGRKVIKGILISVPIALVVLILLISADDAFARIFKGISRYLFGWLQDISFVSLIGRILVIGILFVYFVSILYNLLHKDTSFSVLHEIKRPKIIKLDSFSVNTLLTILNVIYLLFCIMQIWAVSTNIYTEVTQYSRSARQGFFQLVIVSFINLVVILISTANRKEQTNLSVRYRKVMNLLLIGFNIVLLFLSFVRMNQYESKYGYTLLRLLVYWTILTEAILMIPTVIYILKKKIALFQSYFVIITTMYVLLNFVNIDTMIAKRNVDRYSQTGKIDFTYLSQELGAEAVPQIKRLYEELQNKTGQTQLKEEVNRYLYRYLSNHKKDYQSWQSFNFPRYKAKRVLNSMTLGPSYEDHAVNLYPYQL